MIKFFLLFLISNEFRKYLGSFLRFKLNLNLFVNNNIDDSDSINDVDDDVFSDKSSYKKYYSNDSSIINENNINKNFKLQFKIFNTNKLFRINI